MTPITSSCGRLLVQIKLCQTLESRHRPVCREPGPGNSIHTMCAYNRTRATRGCCLNLDHHKTGQHHTFRCHRSVDGESIRRAAQECFVEHLWRGQDSPLSIAEFPRQPYLPIVRILRFRFRFNRFTILYTHSLLTHTTLCWTFLIEMTSNDKYHQVFQISSKRSNVAVITGQWYPQGCVMWSPQILE
jgi:hypothetical protein